MSASNDFNKYNGSRPFVLVDIGRDDPGRGDTHGYLGIAKRVAEKTGADFLFIDHLTLESMYPAPPTRDLKLAQLFTEKGYPDILFSRRMTPETRSRLSDNAKGLIIQSVNETLPGELDIGSRLTYSEIVPHHLTPELLAYEGHKFATEYEDLPRPFIGVLMADPQKDEAENLAKHLASLKTLQDGATVFVCTCHRTAKGNYKRFSRKLRNEAARLGADVKIIEFDYKTTEKYFGLENTWNPYIGLIDQADHLIVSGTSLSITSEALASGRAIYSTTGYFSPRLEEDGYVLDIFDVSAKGSLVTIEIPPLDMASECADKIIETHLAHVMPKEKPEPESAFGKIGAKLMDYLTPKAPKYKYI